MASNVVSVLVYRFNTTGNQAPSRTFAFPATGCLLQDCIDSPTRSLDTGYNVYTNISYQGALYYCRETISQLVTLFNQ